MSTHRSVVIAGVIGMMALIGFFLARRSPADGTAPPSEGALGSAPQESMAELRRLPSQAESSEADLLDKIRQEIGSPLDRFMFGESTGNVDAGTGETGERVPFRDMVANEAQRDRQSTVNPYEDYRPRMPAVDPASRYATALRDASRALDAAAADLEDAEAYQFADQLRERASALRLEARQSQNETAIE